MTLRPFTINDAPIILSWIKDETAFRKWSADRYPVYPPKPEDMLAQYATDNNFPFTAINDDGNVVGHIMLRYPDPSKTVIRLGFVIVDDNPRGKGYGKQMLRLAYQEVKASGDFLDFARQYAFSQDYRVARSALWGLTKASKEELSQLQVILNELIEQAMQTDNSSVRRLSLNVVERLKMSEDDLRTDFLDFCFEHMMDVEEYPGIQSVCMKLAFRMCSFYPELLDELKRTIEAMEIDYYKPAVKCVRNRILNGILK